MKKIINYYPTLNDNQLLNVFPEVKYTFFYFDGDKNKHIINHDDSVGNNISLITKDTDWSYLESNLSTEIKITVANGSLLYGEQGVAPKGSKIGIGVEFFSQKSRIRDIVTIDEYLDDDELVHNHTFPFEIKKDIYLGDVDITIFVYLKKSAKKVDNREKFLNNDEGILLGDIDHKKLFLLGVGSLFPIYIENLEDNKLWHFSIDYDNPEYDKFSECTKLVFNSKHKDYKLLDPKNQEYCERLGLEIVNSSLFITFSKLKEEGYLNNLNDSYEDGSIMSLVAYYRDTFDFDFANSMSIFKSLQNIIDKR